MWCVQPSSTRSRSTPRPIMTALKFSIRSRCHPGWSCSAKSLVGRAVVAHADCRRRALEHVHVLRRLGERRHALDRAAAGPDDADDLVGQLREARVVGRAAGVLVVPPGGVERLALEVLHPRDPGQLHEVEDPGRHRRGTGPGSRRRGRCGSPSASRRSSHSLVSTPVWNSASSTRPYFVRDRVEVPADLVAGRVARRGDVVHLLEHRHVDVGLDVAQHAGVAVPVPGPADPAGLVDQPDPLHARLAQLRAEDHAARPGADDRDPIPTASMTGARSTNGVNGSRRYSVNRSSPVRSWMTLRSSVMRLARSAGTWRGRPRDRTEGTGQWAGSSARLGAHVLLSARGSWFER